MKLNEGTFKVLYNIGVNAFFGAVKVASPFHAKAKKMIAGRSEVLSVLKKKRAEGDRYIWIHAASLGEFEQGRPLIELIKKEQPHLKVCLTFFSPSGYEVAKNYKHADIVTYLPFDTSDELSAFIDLLAPEKAIFVKYEIWYNTLKLLRERGIDTYFISAVFREDQYFFKEYAEVILDELKAVKHIFVQNSRSEELLRQHGFVNMTTTGDTRIDRVASIRKQAKEVEEVARFAEQAKADGKLVLMMGSSWEKDEEVMLPLLKNYSDKIATVIVPHEITTDHLKSIDSAEDGHATRLTQIASAEEAAQVEVMVVDKMGFLSSLYRYADIAYIGGGFGRGVHNVPEAAVYGIPVLVGPNNKKFVEIQQLMAKGAVFQVENTSDAEAILTKLIDNPQFRKEAGEKASVYIIANVGTTQQIYDHIFA